MPATPSLHASPPLLEFEAARLTLDADLPPTRPLDLRISPGDLVLVDATDVPRSAAMADAACGLAPPASGRVRFLGHDWSTVPPDSANALRGLTGRLLPEGAWIDQLSTVDNVLLQRLHHGTRGRRHLVSQAAELARHFGLPGIPLARPSRLTLEDRRRASMVRAFLGMPRLVLIEPLPHLADTEFLEPLVNALRRLRDRGGAALWLTLDGRVWRDASLPVTRRLRIIGAGIFEGQRGA